jgi:hypothetical protein
MLTLPIGGIPHPFQGDQNIRWIVSSDVLELLRVALSSGRALSGDNYLPYRMLASNSFLYAGFQTLFTQFDEDQSPPEKPVLRYPPNGETNVSLTPDLKTPAPGAVNVYKSAPRGPV